MGDLRYKTTFLAAAQAVQEGLSKASEGKLDPAALVALKEALVAAALPVAHAVRAEMARDRAKGGVR